MKTSSNIIEPRYTVTLELTEQEVTALIRFHGKFSQSDIKDHLRDCNTELKDLMCYINGEIYRTYTELKEL